MDVSEVQPVKLTLEIYVPKNAPSSIVVTLVSIAMSPSEHAQVGSHAEIQPVVTCVGLPVGLKVEGLADEGVNVGSVVEGLAEGL